MPQALQRLYEPNFFAPQLKHSAMVTEIPRRLASKRHVGLLERV